MAVAKVALSKGGGSRGGCPPREEGAGLSGCRAEGHPFASAGLGTSVGRNDGVFLLFPHPLMAVSSFLFTFEH